MMKEDEYSELLNASRKILDESCQTLDSQTLLGLQAARREALRQVKKPVHTSLDWWVPMVSFATVGVLVVSLFLLPPKAIVQETPLLADLELIKNTEKLELMEDLEFYVWLLDEDLSS